MGLLQNLPGGENLPSELTELGKGLYEREVFRLILFRIYP